MDSAFCSRIPIFDLPNLAGILFAFITNIKLFIYAPCLEENFIL
ncbi:Transcription factor-like protein DPB [Iris pallida]|uniref:Transcription factor-like protein DPB n=1 Tax=Iris pallida TaxID=29817 RepID=A0AAX6DM50_IRIPA|nr:Transcription factor-like protein DPB [Iris pallida]KAJ6854302.1 Transcription factor-like protein DPB [Iris pallida]